MSKAVLISIRPKWCELIASGKKTIEIRKTAPKIETPFKCYIYCTSNGRPLVYGDKPCADGWTEAYTQTYGYSREEADKIWGVMNGKVIGEFVCDSIFPLSFYASDVSFFDTEPPLPVPGTCLTDKEIAEYLGNGKTGYGWHISNLRIYEKPKALSDYHSCSFCDYRGVCPDGSWCQPLKRPPQSWCYVEAIT